MTSQIDKRSSRSNYYWTIFVFLILSAKSLQVLHRSRFKLFHFSSHDVQTEKEHKKRLNFRSRFNDRKDGENKKGNEIRNIGMGKFFQGFILNR